MTDSSALILGSMSLAMLALSTWWTVRAFHRDGIDIGKGAPLWLSRKGSPFWFWFWMSLYFVNILMWLFFAIVFLGVKPPVS